MTSILEKGVDCQVFETDCAKLVLIIQNPDEWPAFSIISDQFRELRFRFPRFVLSLIPRSVNLKMDCLAHFNLQTVGIVYRLLEKSSGFLFP